MLFDLSCDLRHHYIFRVYEKKIRGGNYLNIFNMPLYDLWLHPIFSLFPYKYLHIWYFFPDSPVWWLFCDGVNDLVSCDLLRPKASYVCLLTREMTKISIYFKSRNYEKNSLSSLFSNITYAFWLCTKHIIYLYNASEFWPEEKYT